MGFQKWFPIHVITIGSKANVFVQFYGVHWDHTFHPIIWHRAQICFHQTIIHGQNWIFFLLEKKIHG